MTFDPEQNRIPTGLLTADERAALGAAKHGWEICTKDRRWVHSPIAILEIDDAIYRAKPAPAPTIIVNGIEVPEPVREALEEGCKYWLADVAHPQLTSVACWGGYTSEHTALDRGLIHLTEEAAVAHAKAMLAPSMQGDV